MAEKLNDNPIKEIINIINTKNEKWAKQMPEIEKKLLDEIIGLSNELELINGKIKPSINNIKLIIKIKDKLNKLIEKDEYNEDLKDIKNTVSQITKLQNKYFSGLVDQFKVPKVLNEIENQARNSITEQLGINGISTAVLEPVKNILLKNVTSGGSKDDFIEEVRGYLTKTNAGDGKLTRYTTQIVTDSLNQYSRTYNQILTDDLGFEWYMYVGSNKDTTRDFCKTITNCKDLDYIHVSQLKDLIEGNICGEKIPLNKKTGLPNGMIEGTNQYNLLTNAGGYNCNHQFIGIPEAIVPQEFLDKINKKEEQKPIKQELDISKLKIIREGDVLDIDDLQIAKLTGLPSGLEGTMKIINDEFADTSVYIYSKGLTMTRIFDWTNKEIINDYFEIDKDSPYKGQGAIFFKNQIDEAIDYGFIKIKTYAAGAAKNQQYNGYYTWARLGYVPNKNFEIDRIIKRFNRDYNTNVMNFEELMATKEGQKFWKEYGVGWDGKFDLSNGSYSRRTLENYIKAKNERN